MQKNGIDENKWLYNARMHLTHLDSVFIGNVFITDEDLLEARPSFHCIYYFLNGSFLGQVNRERHSEEGERSGILS